MSAKQISNDEIQRAIKRLVIIGGVVLVLGYVLAILGAETIGWIIPIGVAGVVGGFGTIIYAGSPRHEARLLRLKWRNGQMVEPGGRDDVPYGEYLRTRTDAELDDIVDDEIGW